MNISRILSTALLAACLPWLAACGNESTPPANDADGGVFAEVSAEVREDMRNVAKEVREELATENIGISDNDQPKAEITPQGDLLIEGRQVAVTPEQRALLLEYRGHIIYMAENGAAIGIQGASLATDAIGHAFASVFTGDTAEMEAEIEAKAEKIARQAMTTLCKRMPAMLQTEQQLAASLPEFAPYADMTQDDIDDCRNGDGHYSTQ